MNVLGAHFPDALLIAGGSYLTVRAAIDRTRTTDRELRAHRLSIGALGLGFVLYSGSSFLPISDWQDMGQVMAILTILVGSIWSQKSLHQLKTPDQ